MARVYYKHDWVPGAEAVRLASEKHCFAVYSNRPIHSSDYKHYHVVNEGTCWAVRVIYGSTDHNNAQFICVDVSADKTGKQILLKDLLHG